MSMYAILQYWQILVSWWDAIAAFGGLIVVILFSHWALVWSYGLLRDEDGRRDDLADFQTMDLSPDERKSVAIALQSRLIL